MTIERPTVNDMNTITENLRNEGQTSRADVLYNFIAKYNALARKYAALETAAREFVKHIKPYRKDNDFVVEISPSRLRELRRQLDGDK